MEGSEIIQSLLETNAKLTDQIVELSRALAESRQPTYPQPIQEFSTQPLWTAETEEDALHAFKAGLIGKDELEDTLKEIGFMNAELIVPSSL